MAAELLHFTLILVLTTAIAMFLRLFKQPPIIAYILAGLIAGPALLGWSAQAEFLGAFSSIGIALLLFLVGISLDLRSVRRVGLVSVITGVGQVLFTSAVGYALGLLLGFGTLASIYVAIALTFSSTIIIVKLLSDKNEIDSLHGQIAIGFLIIQDLIAVGCLVFISALAAGSGDVAATLLAVGLRGIIAALVLWGASVYLLPPLLHAAGKSQEVLFLFSISLCFALAVLFAGIGLSLEIGALVAGLLLASTPYSHEIASRVRPLRDFFIVLFFVLLGSQMQVGNIGPLLLPALVLSAFVLIGNPLIVLFLMGLLGYSKRTAFMAGLTVAQISEFSLILVALGQNVGHLDNEIGTVITVVGILTILISSYLIMHAAGIYKRFGRLIPYYRRGVHRHEHRHAHHTKPHEIVIFGHNRAGFAIVDHFIKHGKDFLVVDFNPEIVGELRERGEHAMFGDADDVELYEELRLEKTRLVISTISDRDTNLLVLDRSRHANPDVTVILTAAQADDALALYEAGADYVIVPHIVGGDHATLMLDLLFTDLSGFLEQRAGHMKKLKHHERHTHGKRKHR